MKKESNDSMTLKLILKMYLLYNESIILTSIFEKIKKQKNLIKHFTTINKLFLVSSLIIVRNIPSLLNTTIPAKVLFTVLYNVLTCSCLYAAFVLFLVSRHTFHLTNLSISGNSTMDKVINKVN